MKVIEIKKFGGPEVLELKDVEIGKPGPKEVLIKNCTFPEFVVTIKLEGKRSLVRRADFKSVEAH